MRPHPRANWRLPACPLDRQPRETGNQLAGGCHRSRMNKHYYFPRKKNQPAQIQIIQELHRSQQSMQAFVQAMPVPLSINGIPDGRFLAANRKFLDLLEFSRETIVGRTPEELGLWASDAFSTAEMLSLLRQHNWIKNREIDLLARSGRIVSTLLSAEHFWNHGRESMLISLVDITEHRRFEATLRSRSDLLLSTGEMSRTLAEVLEPRQVYDRLEATIHQLMPEVTAVSISLYDTQHQRLSLVYGDPEQPLDPPHYPPAGRPAEERRPLCPPCTGHLHQAARLTMGTDVHVQPTLTVAMVSKGEEIGVIQVQAKEHHSFTEAEGALLSWIANTAAAAIQSSRLCEQLHQTNQSLDKAFEATLDSLARALELREQENRGHTDRVILMTVELASRMGISGKDLERIRFGALLHDIGKMGIPDYILNKPGPLTEDEWVVMRKHPVYAYELLYPVPQFREIIDIPYCHH
ncbi:MAG TPA: HD domain-containing phosphohydrolase, partial [Anaerolineaceae bacterium]|nr:HD domain-containing phosphohydrolase [Anaerolineaceae bacterium]